jgi:hypothetical protein
MSSAILDEEFLCSPQQNESTARDHLFRYYN